jgi:hypothetical protein
VIVKIIIVVIVVIIEPRTSHCLDLGESNLSEAWSKSTSASSIIHLPRASGKRRKAIHKEK